MPDFRRLSRALLTLGVLTATCLSATGTAGATPLIDLPPLPGLDVLTAPENGTSLLDVLANDTDPEGDPLTITSVTSPLNGTATPIDGGSAIQYVPLNNFLGLDTFTYTVSDGHGNTGLGVVNLTVVAPPSLPTGVPGTFVALKPARLLDTRTNLGGTTPAAHGIVPLQVAGLGGVPASGVAAVVLNVTVTHPTAPGYVTAYANGGSRPSASNLNYLPGQTVPNLVVAPVGSDGKVALYNGSAGSTPLVADVAGYFLDGPSVLPGTYTPLTPARLLDTRTGLGGTTPGPNGIVHLQVGGHGGVLPAGVSAVVLNVTATRPTKPGFVTAYADGGSRPSASNLNYLPGQTVPNLVVAPVSQDGKVALFNGSAGSTPLVADVFGYFLAGQTVVPGAYVPLAAPSRLLDTRIPRGGSTPAGKETVHLLTNGAGGIPGSNVAAVVMNLTETAPTAAGYITAYGDGTARPTASNLNFLPGQTRPNLAITPVGSNGRVALYNGSTGRTPLVSDVAGYFLGDPTALTSTFSDGTVTLVPKCVAGLLAAVGVSLHLDFADAGSKLVYLTDGGLVTLVQSLLALDDGSGLISLDLAPQALLVGVGQSTVRIFARNGTSPTDPIVFDHTLALPTC